jgi:hypothetical protein
MDNQTILYCSLAIFAITVAWFYMQSDSRYSEESMDTFDPTDTAKCQYEYYRKKVETAESDFDLDDLEQKILSYCIRFEHDPLIKFYEEELEWEVRVRRAILYCNRVTAF